MSSLSATIEGIGFWTTGIASWQGARAFVAGGALPEDPPRKPTPQLLAPNERRRAPETVAVALEVALAACKAAGREPATLPAIFASTHGDLAITDYMCETLAHDPRSVSPTRFHNSVHNAAVGYWTIGNGCTHASTAVSAFDASFAQGLVEALAQLHGGLDAVLLAAYDSGGAGPMRTTGHGQGLLGGSLVLARDSVGTRLRATLVDGDAPTASGALALYAAGNAMSQMLPLFDALAGGREDVVLLKAGPGRLLRVELAHD